MAVIFVESGFSSDGAIAAGVGASVVELAMGEFSVSDLAELRWLTGRRTEVEGSGT